MRGARAAPLSGGLPPELATGRVDRRKKQLERREHTISCATTKRRGGAPAADAAAVSDSAQTGGSGAGAARGPANADMASHIISAWRSAVP